MASDPDRELASRRSLDESFSGSVVPEATPNPRSIRFVTPPIHDGPSRWYESDVDVDDARVARLFADFDDVANVLVGPAFVAVGLRHPDRWEQLLDPVLRAVTAEFASAGEADEPLATRAAGPVDPSASRPESTREGGSALERSWKALGSLRSAKPTDLDRIVAAAASESGADRQVAARLLAGADESVAARVWRHLLDDSSRGVRRAVVDAMVDHEQQWSRPLLEHALRDDDAWTRWKALRGLIDLGIEPSHAAVVALLDDPDFRVRLEAARARS